MIKKMAITASNLLIAQSKTFMTKTLKGLFLTYGTNFIWETFVKPQIMFSFVVVPGSELWRAFTQVHSNKGETQDIYSRMPFKLHKWDGATFLQVDERKFQKPRTTDIEYVDSQDWFAPFTMYGLAKDKDKFLAFCLDKSHKYRGESDDNNLVIYSQCRNGRLDGEIESSPKKLEHLVFEKEFIDDIIKDLLSFLANKEWYAKLGIPYRRGYLLYGPPGTGKTSLIQALSHEVLNRSLANVDLGTLDQDSAMNLLRNVTSQNQSRSDKGVVLCIDDVDTFFSGRAYTGGGSSEENEVALISKASSRFGNPEDPDKEDPEAKKRRKEKEKKLRFKALLSLLDCTQIGLPQEPIIFFLTANNPGVIDPAMLRPGRIDMKLHMGPLNNNLLNEFVKRLVGDLAPESVIATFVTEVEESKVVYTPAQIQGYLLDNREDFEKALLEKDGFKTYLVNQNRFTVDHLTSLELEDDSAMEEI